MAKQKRGTAKEERAVRRGQYGEPKRPYTLKDCMKMGRLANILFVVFIIICVLYYYSLHRIDGVCVVTEIIAYVVEFSGFMIFSIGIIWLDRLVRQRGIMKVLMLVYIVIEAVLMLLEFQIMRLSWYNGLDTWLMIAHTLFSAGVALSLLQLDPHNKSMQIIVIITTSIILAGMFFAIAGYRVYASILVNAVAYIFFFTAMLHQLRLDELDIDCYGDQAKVTTFSSTMFADVPELQEKPKKERKSLQRRVRDVVDQLQSEEHMVLTDTDEKFEYEFGVDADDADDTEQDDDDES